MEKRPKTIFQLDSPFTAVQWPQTTPPNQETILELLCNILSPIGRCRSNHVSTSKGKRDKKRKRHEAQSGEAPAIPTSPPRPEISSYLAVGLNNVTRILESSSQKSKPKTDVETTGEEETPHSEEMSKESDPAQVKSDMMNNPLINGHFSAIFVCSSSQPTILNEHLPQLVITASLAHPGLPQVRLVELPKGSNERLCEALGIPRVSFVGLLEGAPHSKSLVDLVRECVPEIEIPWLQQAKESKYLPVKINAVETFSPAEKKARA